MLRVFRAAKARPEVLRYIQDRFSCPDCASHPRQRANRKAAVPRTYQFNKIVGCDTFKVTMGGTIYNFLNLVDSGTNYQMVCLVGGDGLEHSALHTWMTYTKSWLK